MSSPKPQAGKHRAAKARRAPKAALKTSLTLSSMAVVATGFAIGSGALSSGADDTRDASSAAGSVTDATSQVADDPPRRPRPPGAGRARRPGPRSTRSPSSPPARRS